MGRKRLPDVASTRDGRDTEGFKYRAGGEFRAFDQKSGSSSPAGASLPQTEKADYPDKLQEEFRDRRFAHEDVPRLHPAENGNTDQAAVRRRVGISRRRLTVALATSCVTWSMRAMSAFTPPGPEERQEAIGPTNRLPGPLRRALEPRADFAPLPQPQPSDWHANHPERGQSFADFVRSGMKRPDRQHQKLYLQPLGEFAAGASPSLAQLRAFAAAFFTLEVDVLAALDIARSGVTTRLNPHKRNRQLLTTDILTLLRTRVPQDAYAILGITMEDLYPDPSWNFVFGQASLREGVGVYSFARYDPRFNDPQARASGTLLLQRSCKVLAHEMTHMFGVQHCIYFHCLMNGSNHLAESDARPIHMCPVDLRKLQESIGFDVVGRYRRLLQFYLSAGFTEEASWLSRRLDFITRESR